MPETYRSIEQNHPQTTPPRASFFLRALLPLREKLLRAQPFTEAEKSYLVSQLKSASVVDPNDPTEGGKFRRLSNTVRDMKPLEYKQAQELSHHIWQTNSLGSYLIELFVNYCTGEEFSVETKIQKNTDGEWKDNEEASAKAQEVWDNFYEHPANNLENNFSRFVQDFFVNGELALDTSVNRETDEDGNMVGDNMVFLGYLDPINIEKVNFKKGNILIVESLEFSVPGTAEPLVLPVVHFDLRPEVSGKKNPFFMRMNGKVLYWRLNHVTNQSRGFGHLYRLADFLDLLDQFVFDSAQGFQNRNAFVWWLQMNGAKPEQVEEKARQYERDGPPPSTSVVVTNEEAEWKVLTPELNAADSEKAIIALETFIVGSRGFPIHFFGHGGDVNRACHDMATETLTESGWKFYDDITDDDKIGTYNPESGLIEFHNFTSRHVYDYSGEMIHFQSVRSDVCVTPDHRMYLKRERNDPESEAYEIVKAEDVTQNRWWLKVSGDWEHEEMGGDYHLPEMADTVTRRVYPEVVIPIDLWLEFLGYFISEGHARAKKGEWVVQISQKKAAGLEKMRECVERMPFPFVERDQGDGAFSFRCNDKPLNIWLRENCGQGARNKHLPGFWPRLSKRQLVILFEALMLGDGTVDTREGRSSKAYYTTSDRLADEVQIMCLKLGYRARKVWSEGGRCWRVLISDGEETLLTTDHISREFYRGRVYCFNVPNHLFVTRRNGCVAITHNTASEMSDPTMRMFKATQKVIKGLVKDMCRFVIDQAVVGKTMKMAKDERLVINVNMFDFDREDQASIGSGFQQAVTSLSLATGRGWVDDEDAKKVMDNFLMKYGIEPNTDMTAEELRKKREEDNPYAGLPAPPGAPPHQQQNDNDQGDDDGDGE